MNWSSQTVSNSYHQTPAEHGYGHKPVHEGISCQYQAREVQTFMKVQY